MDTTYAAAIADAALLAAPDERIDRVPVKVGALTAGVPFSLDGGTTWFLPHVVLWGNVSVFMDHGRSTGFCVRVPAERDADAITLRAIGAELLDVDAYGLAGQPAPGLVFVCEGEAFQILTANPGGLDDGGDWRVLRLRDNYEHTAYLFNDAQ